MKSAEEGAEDPNLEEKRILVRERIQGEPLTNAERKALVEKCHRNRTKRQINLGIHFLLSLSQLSLKANFIHWVFDDSFTGLKC